MKTSQNSGFTNFRSFNFMVNIFEIRKLFILIFIGSSKSLFDHISSQIISTILKWNTTFYQNCNHKENMTEAKILSFISLLTSWRSKCQFPSRTSLLSQDKTCGYFSYNKLLRILLIYQKNLKIYEKVFICWENFNWVLNDKILHFILERKKNVKN